MTQYRKLKDLGDRGRAVYLRLIDNKQAIAKTSWFKQSGLIADDGYKLLMARSRVKAIRLNGVNWYNEIIKTNEETI